MRLLSMPPSTSSRRVSRDTRSPPAPRLARHARTVPPNPAPGLRPGHRPWCRHAWADTSQIPAGAWTFLLGSAARLRDFLEGQTIAWTGLDNPEQGRCRYQANRLNEASNAPVAQLDRALPSEGKGHTFESCRVRQIFNGPFRTHGLRFIPKT